MIRVALVLFALTVLLVLPTPWVSPGARSALVLSAVGTLLAGLFFVAHWVMEKVSPAPYEPFIPRHAGRGPRGGTPAGGKGERRRDAA